MGECRRVLGIDVGIASCGWGVIEVRDRAGSIFAKDGKPAVGVRCFDASLVYKTGEPKAAQRRSARAQRRVIRRRRQRMNAIRDLPRLLPEMLSHPRPAYHGAIGREAGKSDEDGGGNGPGTGVTLRLQRQTFACETAKAPRTPDGNTIA